MDLTISVVCYEVTQILNSMGRLYSSVLYRLKDPKLSFWRDVGTFSIFSVNTYEPKAGHRKQGITQQGNKCIPILLQVGTIFFGEPHQIPMLFPTSTTMFVG